MTHFSDDLYLGGFLATQGLSLFATGNENPTAQIGAGPMGRIAFLSIVPLTLGTTNVATAQALTAATALAMTAGTGVTKRLAPDGSGATVYAFDFERCVSLTSASNLSAVNITVVGYDQYGRKETCTLAGPNADTVTTLKAFLSVLSVTPSATNASTMSVGSSDIFGLPFAMLDAGYLVSVGWNNTLARDAGTFVAADTTSPATASTGDPAGTYRPSSASNGTKRLVIGMHLNAGQCGVSPTIVNLLGVTPV